MARNASDRVNVYLMNERLVLMRAVLEDDNRGFAGLFPDFHEFRAGNTLMEVDFSFGP